MHRPYNVTYVLYKATTEIIKKEVRLKHWSTPRASNAGRSKVLTARGVRDLPNQVAFGTSGGHKAGMHMNPEWVEWLMGVPIGFSDTKC